MRKLFIVTAVAVCGACVVPAVASAAKKFESGIGWTHVEKAPTEEDPTLMGTVTSESPKCVKNRSVRITSVGDSIEKPADADGVFGLSLLELAGFGEDDVEASVAKKRFGKKGKRKVCLPASGADLTFESHSASVTNFAYNEGTNTFSGTIVSSEPMCFATRDLQVDLFDGENFTSIGFTTSDGNGAFSYTHNAALDPGSYDAFSSTAGFVDFENGDGSSVTCGQIDSNDIVIGGP